MTAIAVSQFALPATDQVVEVELPEPGIVRRVEIGGAPQRIAGIDGKQRMVEKAVLFVEFNPDSDAKRTRVFLQLGPGQAYEPPENMRPEFVGVGLSPATGAVGYIYELVAEPAMVVA